MYVARDKGYDLWLFTEKPVRNIFQNYWYSEEGETMRLDSHDVNFKNITWADEPIKVELKIV